ncbi:hypothetical protein N9891_00760 [bacterium]|nr:hypothetical protein [bacterium]
MNTLKSFFLSSLLLGSAATAQTIIADAAADYLTAPDYLADTTAPSAPPTGWEYLSSDMATGGTETPLTAQTTLGNGGNDGFGIASGTATFQVGVLGGVTGGTQYEIFNDGFDGNLPNVPTGNEGVVGTDLLLHPGTSVGTEFIIVRYTITAEDLTNGTSVDITGSFRDLAGRPDRENPAGSVTADIFHNSTNLFSEMGNTGQDPATPGYLTQADGTFNISGLSVVAGDTISFVLGNNGNLTGDETALQASISQGSGQASNGAGISITQLQDTDELQIDFQAVEGLSYNLRSGTNLLAFEIVDGQSGLSADDFPIIIPRPADPKTFYVIESFED